MKSMTLVIFLFLPALLFGATFRVAKDGIALYNEVQPAINAAAAGDTIFIAASTASYQGFNVDRRLVIYGAGTDTIPGQATVVADHINIMGNADSTELNSVWVLVSDLGVDSLSGCLAIRSGALSVQIARCFFENTYSFSNIAIDLWVGDAVSLSLVDCVFRQETYSYYRYPLFMNSNNVGSNVLVYNSIFSIASSSPNYHFAIFSGNNVNQLTVRNCFFNNCHGVIQNAIGSVENCVLMAGSGVNLLQSAPNVIANYCSVTGSVPYGNGNFAVTGTPFVNYVSGNPRRSDYHLSANSVLRNAGNPIAPTDTDGSRADIGIYGGQTPFVEFGLPDFPIVLELEVPASVPQNGVLHVGSRGRVGPGN